MSAIKTVLRIGGTIAFALGLMCLPVLGDQFMKRRLSLSTIWPTSERSHGSRSR